MQIILFGLSGAGKNFVGEILAKYFPFYFWDADKDLPQNMQDCITQKKFFTQEMRDEFTQSIIKKMTNLTEQYDNLAVAQAFYKEKNRLQLQMSWPDAKWIYVKSHPKNILARLQTRGLGVSADYAEKISINFEEPQLPHLTLNNDSDESSIIQQLEILLSPK